MAIIKKQINDTNASFRNINAGDAKNTDLFLDQNQRAFFGEKENIDVRLHKNNLAQAILFIASVLPRKYDCSSVHKKIFYSSEFVIDSLRKLDGFFGDADEKIVTWHIRQAVEQKNGKIDDRFYLNNLIQQFSYIDANGKSCESKFTIRDYLAGGYSSIEFHSKENGSVYDFYVTNSNEYQENYGAEQDKENDDIEKSESRNRIIFGAPGTGKSFLLKEMSTPFESQKKSNADESSLIKAAVADAISKSGKSTLLNAIGFKYSSSLKNIAKKDLPSFCGYDKINELYVGASAKAIADSINVDDAKTSDIGYVTSMLSDEKRGDNDLLKWANAIGYKFGDFLSSWSRDDLKETFDLSEPQKWWMYRGAQASQAEISEIEAETKFVERVTFHPNYSYAQFVGTYKPIQDEDDSKGIVYSYVPGPFMRTYVRAKRAEQNGTGEKFLLIIEEINRANVAAVFGDVFQLLDRHGSGEHKGESEYPVAASEDIKRYLRENGIQDCNELKIPSNMYIWATMNSADQGVFPMDTAFKRRWEFEYIGVNDKKEEIEEFEIPMQEKKDDFGNLVKDAEGNVTHEWMKWDDLRTKINDKLTDCGKNEDKLLGPFFISLEKLNSVNGHNEKEAVDFIKSFKSKVLMYLFEDVCKMRPGDLFNCDKMRYSKICKKFDTDGIGVFNF